MYQSEANWAEDELLEHFILVDIERKLIGNKTGASRLVFTVLLKYFQHEARFPIKGYSRMPINLRLFTTPKYKKTLFFLINY
nr:DUF4158 domain-containing protein [Bacillus cereus]